MGFIVGAGATAVASVTAPTDKRAVVKGIYWDIRTATTVALIEAHAGDAAAVASTVVLAASTGGQQAIYGLPLKGKYVAIDGTTGAATSGSVLIWGDYE